MVVASNIRPGIVLIASRIQTAVPFLAMFCWFELTRTLLASRRSGIERWLQPLLLLCAVLELLPGITYGGAVIDRPFPAWGVVYRDAIPTPVGAALFFFADATVILVLLRSAYAWRRGLRHCAQLTIAFAVLFLTGINDALVSMGLLHLPYLVDIGFLFPVGALSLASTARFVADAKALVILRDRLEEVVADRTEALSRTQWALHRAEKLASLGRFAVGVGQEVSDPASVVSASLLLLERSTSLPDSIEVRTSLHDANEAMSRIDALVRRLVEAGGLALAHERVDGTSLHTVAMRAVEEARASCDERVIIDFHVPPTAHVGVGAEVVHQILFALLLNAVDSIPRGRGGHINVTANSVEDGLQHISISGDGQGTVADGPSPGDLLPALERDASSATPC